MSELEEIKEELKTANRRIVSYQNLLAVNDLIIQKLKKEIEEIKKEKDCEQ